MYPTTIHASDRVCLFLFRNVSSHCDTVKAIVKCTYEPLVHDILILIAYAQKPHINANAYISGKARDLKYNSYFRYTSSEGSGYSAHMRRIASAFTAQRCDKYQNLMHWSIYVNN